jgi:arginyl-tRNA synthetase
VFGEFRKDCESALEGIGVKPILEIPRGGQADLALACFKLGKNPVKKAKKISEKLKPSGLIARIEASGPYVNFFADWNKMAELISKEVGKKLNNNGKIIVEYACPNTHKAFHIGHVRNIALGESLSRILEFYGMKVVRANYQGDIGPHVAKCLWGLLNLDKLGLKEPKDNKGRWLGDVYREANRYSKDEKVDEEIREINSELYKRNPKLVKLWQKTRKWSLEYFDSIYKDFGAVFDRFYFEEEVEGDAIKLGEKLLKDKIAKKSDGAIIIDLKKYGLGVYVLITKDGTPLYSIKDFILAELQDKEFKPDKIVHVVGAEQELHFRQLFKSLGFFNKKLAEKEYHLSYGLVNLKSGKMKSREGRVILYEELKEKLIKTAEKICKEKKSKIKSESLALGALKYDMLKISPERVITFDWDRALSFDGNNAPYLQYTYTRCSSVLRKGGKFRVDKFELENEREIRLWKKLSMFNEMVEKATKELRPHIVCNYIYELCEMFNEFYEFVPILKSDRKEQGLALVKTTKKVIANGLYLMGIDALERM